MFHFFKKPKDTNSSPNELLDYCDKEDLEFGSLLTVIFLSSTRVALFFQPNLRIIEVSAHLSAYLLGTACSAGVELKKFAPAAFEKALSGDVLEKLCSADFSNRGLSQFLVQKMKAFYANPTNLTLTRNYFLGFRTAIDLNKLDERIREGLITTFRWKEWDWNDTLQAKFLNTINAQKKGPFVFYEPTDALRAFWDFALIATIVESELIWEPPGHYDNASKWMTAAINLGIAKKHIGELVRNSTFNHGLAQ